MRKRYKNDNTFQPLQKAKSACFQAFKAVKRGGAAAGWHKINRLLLRSRKQPIKWIMKDTFSVFCMTVHLFCVNLRVVMQRINLSARDKKLRLLPERI